MACVIIASGPGHASTWCIPHAYQLPRARLLHIQLLMIRTNLHTCKCSVRIRYAWLWPFQSRETHPLVSSDAKKTYSALPDMPSEPCPEPIVKFRCSDDLSLPSAE